MVPVDVQAGLDEVVDDGVAGEAGVAVLGLQGAGAPGHGRGGRLELLQALGQLRSVPLQRMGQALQGLPADPEGLPDLEGQVLDHGDPLAALEEELEAGLLQVVEALGRRQGLAEGLLRRPSFQELLPQVQDFHDSGTELEHEASIRVLD